MMERDYTKEYRDLRIHCLYGKNPYDILNLSVRANDEQLRKAFRSAIMVLDREMKKEPPYALNQDDSSYDAGQEEPNTGNTSQNHEASKADSEREEHKQILERLVFAYNILSDPQRRKMYDQDHTIEQIYKDERSLRYHNQITVAQMEAMMATFAPSVQESSGKINVTFIAIVASFLIVFESLLLIFTSGDARLAVYILNACCLFIVATVELIRYRKSGDASHSDSNVSNYQDDDTWNHFFYDPLGLRAEILDMPFEKWSEQEFSYIALFNRMSLAEYKENVLENDLKVYDLFKEVIDEQYKKISIERFREQLDDRGVDKAYQIYRKWYDIMNDPELKTHLWELISEKEMKAVLNSVETSDRDRVREALYRLYYYWNAAGTV